MNSLNNIIWNYFFLPGMLLCGALLSFGTGFPQFRRFGKAMRLSIGRAFRSDPEGGGISPFQAASTALASTVGTGNIVGTAQAICMGGPGAVFWLWLAAFFGMMVKCAEIFLSVQYRKQSPDGWLGGPMYYICAALGSPFAPLAFAWAAFAALSALGMGNLSQINGAISAIVSAADKFFIIDAEGELCLRLAVGVVLGLLLALICSGGAKSIGQAAGFIVPFMSLAFILLSLIVIICHAQRLPGVLVEILSLALSPKAAAGAAGGLSVREAIHWGIRRSAFSNEAGLGSSAIAHAAADTDSPYTQSMWGIFEVFADTILICSATAFCILCAAVPIPYGSIAGPELLQSAFATVFGDKLSSLFIAGAMGLFAFATVIGWYFYAGRCTDFLAAPLKKRGGIHAALAGILSRLYRLFYIICVPLGCVMSTEFVWEAADTANALMSVPNLLALFLLSGSFCRHFNKAAKEFN